MQDDREEEDRDGDEDKDREPGPWEYRAREGFIRKLIPGEVIAAVPAARKAAEVEGRRVQFDFLDDEAVLKMLRLRSIDDEQLISAGKRAGYPTAFILFGLFVYWGAYVQAWESDRNKSLFYAGAGAIVAVTLLLFVVTLVRQWGNRPRQKVRARAAAYRKIAHIAAENGGDIPTFYPHYGPYPFAANFHPEADELELPERNRY
ncbi:hypothetical protein [Streptomyces kanamyceticus]|uniref:Uncharacterized protein n=1 Tax=Streptomyces kanamyceticus TaxID=1967 RepID=A0A5J6GHE4_STRKN|nr:hypothetical protein [Streptomyces kanamyceticus]QEU92566.1 hypothetical protein CP970_18130 [Streptomyces kanamyceticus]